MDPELLEAFQTEAVEHLQSMEQELMDAEHGRHDPEAAKRMFISAHTVKGGAAMLGMVEAQLLAAAMEEVLGRHREARDFPDEETALLLLQGSGLLRGLVMETEVGERGALARHLANELRGRIGEPEVTAPTAPIVPEQLTPSSALRHVWRALLVDQSPASRMVAGMVLKDAGYQVDAVADGRDALQRLANGPYDLLVTGLEARSMSGIDLAAAARNASGGADLFVVVLADPAAQKGAGAAGGIVDEWVASGVEGQQRLRELAARIQDQKRQK